MTRIASGTDARRVGEPPGLVVADASPLIGLAAAGVFDSLRELLGTIVISRAVREEIAAGEGRPGAAELTAAMRAGWIRGAPTPMATWRYPELDVGEASTIALALEHDGPALVLVDDTLGREHAAAMGLAVSDLADVLLGFKRAGLVDTVAPLLDRLAAKGFEVPVERRAAVLREADEGPVPGE